MLDLGNDECVFKREVMSVYCVCKGSSKLGIGIMNTAALTVACPPTTCVFVFIYKWI